MKTPDSPFPVYERLLTSGQITPEPLMKFIDAREPLDLITEQADSRHFDADDFGPVTPPYPSLWFETPNPGLVTVEKGGITGIGISIETDIESMDVRGGGRRYKANQVITWLVLDGIARRCPVVTGYTTHKDGHLDRISTGMVPDDVQMYGGKYGTKEWEVVTDVSHRVSIAALFVLSLMHCRNVPQTPAVYQPQPRRKTSRRRPAIDYHIIKLPAPRRGGSGGQSGAAGHPGTRLHTVRGHFKTYTADAPLMGRAVGTYYWSHHARGSAENGEIISSYQVDKGVPA